VKTPHLLHDPLWARALDRDLAGRLIASQEAERARIARDLHDGVCQDVAAFGVDVSYLRRNAGRLQHPEVQQVLLSLERRAASVAESLRLLSHGLHPSLLQHIGVVAALRAHCAEVQRQHAMRVTFVADESVDPKAPLVALSLFRIAQEALRNATRHGRARCATVSLTRDGVELTLTIADDGAGFDVAAARRVGGLGLASIEERAHSIHGRVTIRSNRSEGTSIDVRVPLRMIDHA
jgi:two-component system sensor histidine kinase UhpB